MMVFLQFTEYGACALNNAGHVLWEEHMPTRHKHLEARQKSDDWWDRPTVEQISHRARLEFSGELVRDMIANKTLLPFPHDTRFYRLDEIWQGGDVCVSAMHPDLYEVIEGGAAPFAVPVFEKGTNGQPLFASWGKNANP